MTTENQTENETPVETVSEIKTTVTAEEKNIAFLKNEVHELKEAIRKLQTRQLAEHLQLSVEAIENSGEIKNVKRIKRGLGSIPILESEIREAQDKTGTAVAAAKHLKIHYTTYKKYAKLYGIWKTNVHYKKEGMIVDAEKGRYPLSKLIQGEFPDYPVFRLKDKLIQGGVKKAECEQCGWKERRITDGKLPLILNFDDGNFKNHKLENIKLLCYNCTFCSGKGYIRKGKKYHVLDDPDRVQGADEYVPTRF
jgi:ribosomal protein L29